MLRTASELADLAPWQIYVHDRHWPSGREVTFLPSLVTDAMWTRHGIPGCHAVMEDETQVYRDFIASDVGSLIMEGSLVLRCMPVAGGDWRLLTALDLTPQAVQSAIATGTITLGEKKRQAKHWVFCGAAEANLLLPILEHESGEGDASALLARLISVVRSNLSLISGNVLTSAAGDGTSRVISLLLPTLKPRLGPDDRAKLVRAGADWLTAQFKSEENTGLLKDGFRKLAVTEFAPFMTGRIFDEIWAAGATTTRRLPGRRPAGDAGRAAPAIPAQV